MHLGIHIPRRYVYLITRSLISGVYKEIEKENKCIKAVCVFAHIHSGENPVQFNWFCHTADFAGFSEKRF